MKLKLSTFGILIGGMSSCTSVPRSTDLDICNARAAQLLPTRTSNVQGGYSFDVLLEADSERSGDPAADQRYPYHIEVPICVPAVGIPSESLRTRLVIMDRTNQYVFIYEGVFGTSSELSWGTLIVRSEFPTDEVIPYFIPIQ